MKTRRINIVFSLLLLLLITASCKEDESSIDDKNIDNRPPEEVVATLTESLATVDSLSVFTEALKTINLNKEDVAQGLTIFAPLNTATSNNSRQSSNSKISSSKENGLNFSDEELRDHIIKGVLKLSDLTDGTILVSLSGKTYKITKIGDQIWINGVLILPKEVLSSTRETVFAVRSLLSNTEPTDEPTSTTASIEITVWDASKWSPENPKGVLSAGADVVLYRSHEDYTNSNPAYQLKATEENGKVVFTNVEPGTYYVEVSKDNLSNIFGESEEPVNGLYVGIAADGIFQNQEEVENAALQNDAAVGKLRWLDANADGVINESDYVPLPYESVAVGSNNLSRIEILIDVVLEEEAVLPFPELDEEAIAQEMDIAVNSFNGWFLNLAIIDGLLSDDADTPPAQMMGGIENIDDFNFNPSTQAIVAIWLDGYPIINRLNLIIANDPENKELLGNAIALRAYIYLKLTTYFGGLPLHMQYVNNMMDYYSSPGAEQSEIIDFVIDGLLEAQSMLPASTSDKSKLNTISINALLANAALLKKDYPAVFNYTQNILNSAQYALATDPASIADEALWSSPDNLAPNLESYFGHAKLPYTRLTEIYLMHAEAAIELGGEAQEQAFNKISEIINRKGYTPLTPPLQSEDLRSLWKAEMPKEGNRFANLVRWGTAYETLEAKGFNPGKHNLLPIPQLVLDSNSNLFQNPGY